MRSGGVSRLLPKLRESRILYQRVAFSSRAPSTTNLPPMRRLVFSWPAENVVL
jgi:hypothetical protein